MTDIEINKALALAIGWPLGLIDAKEGNVYCCTNYATLSNFAQFRKFDYRDPAVIWPIADRYKAFPVFEGHQWRARSIGENHPLAWDFTAAKAVALAVIEAAS